MKVEASLCYSVGEVRRLFFPSRSERWIKDTFRTGEFGRVLRDGKGWMISAEAVAAYQERHAVGAVVVALRPGQLGNLKQFTR